MEPNYPNIKVKFIVDKNALQFNRVNEKSSKQFQMSEVDSLVFLLTVETALIQNNVSLDQCNKFVLQAGNDIKNLMAICMGWVTIDFVT